MVSTDFPYPCFSLTATLSSSLKERRAQHCQVNFKVVEGNLPPKWLGRCAIYEEGTAAVECLNLFHLSLPQSRYDLHMFRGGDTLGHGTCGGHFSVPSGSSITSSQISNQWEDHASRNLQEELEKEF